MVQGTGKPQAWRATMHTAATHPRRRVRRKRRRRAGEVKLLAVRARIGLQLLLDLIPARLLLKPFFGLHGAGRAAPPRRARRTWELLSAQRWVGPAHGRGVSKRRGAQAGRA
jgi:hypothetical protein